MRIRRIAAAGCGLLVVSLLGGCGPAAPGIGPSTATSRTLTPSASPTADFTVPGAATSIVRQLVTASGSSQVIMVDVRPTEASVSVLVDGTAHTWAYRNGAIKEIPSDLVYVDQLGFDPTHFDFSDVGALFRAAAAVSGSSTQQELQIVDRQIVDHDSDEIMMSVSTNPETRTVFFYADGTLLPTLDFSSDWGISRGLADAVGMHTVSTSVSVGSAVGASIEYAGGGDTTVRRLRTSKFPVSVSVRSEQAKGSAFDPHRVDARAIWSVLTRLRASGAWKVDTEWSVVVDDRGKKGTPRMYFTVGGTHLTTDLAGSEISQ